MEDKVKISIILLVALFTAAASLPAQGFPGKLRWAAEASLFFFPEGNALASDPMPVLPTIGMAVALPLHRYFGVEATLDLYGTHYRYDYRLDRAVPSAIENRSAFVLGPLLGVQAGGLFPVASFLDVRVYGGLAADLRVVLIASGLNDSDKQGDPEWNAATQTDSVRRYFWGKGRWLFPVAGFGADFALNEKVKLGLDARAWFPLYRLWTKEDLPGIEGWRFGVGARFSFRGEGDAAP
jgi:hypothetical protein